MVKERHMTVIFRADQVGSLIRPASLLAARQAFAENQLTRDQLRAEEDRSIREALDLQRAAGIGIFSDGEMRRDAYSTVFSEAVDGFSLDYRTAERAQTDGTTVRVKVHSKAVCGTLRARRRLAGAEAAFMKANAPGPFKITLPSPCYVTHKSFETGITEAAYPSPEALRADIAAIISDEIDALADDGAAYIQLDEGFIDYVRPEYLEGLRAAGRDPDKVIEQDIAVDNGCYERARARGLTTSMHLCQGSRTAAGRPTQSFEWLAERLLDRLDVDCFLLEYDADRVRGFEPLRYLPRNKIAVLGLISSKIPALEPIDDMLRRIDDAAKFCSVEQLAISTQCGFQGSGTADGAHMTIDDQARKLELVTTIAERVWGTAGAVELAAETATA
jgi:5-methyltetrahydropteroyltriglutamate--homocysteine methyltransferase